MSDHSPSSDSPENRVSRREMLWRVGGTLAAVGGGVWATRRLYDPRGDAGLRPPEAASLKNFFESLYADWGASTPRVSVARAAAGGGVADGGGDDVSPELIRKLLAAALAPMGGIERFIHKGDTVLVKPNVAFDRGPAMGATTNPRVVAEVVQLCRGAGARRVLVADNPIEKAEPCFAKSRIREAAERAGAEVILPAAAHFSPVVIRDRDPDPRRNEALGTWEVFFKPLAVADKVIGLPPIKDHNLCFASMGIKNWYGLLCGRRNQFHQAIHDIVSDLGMMMSPTLVLVDGTRVLMKNGPTGGRLEDVAIGGVSGAPTIVAGVDPVATDAWCLQHLLGRDPGKLRYLELAEQKIGMRIEAGRRSGADGAAQAAGRRFASRDWPAYQRQGLIVEANVA
ncbi:MAG: DUF362 domain-containing protein [Phycisphaerae bacterium]